MYILKHNRHVIMIVANMQVSLAKSKQLIRSIAPAGNLFLLLLLQELRHQGLTFIALYALQRVIEEQEISEFQLRRETGLENYEISRGCKLLASSGLIEISRYEQDRRVRLLTPTRRGIQIHDRILSAAATQLQKGRSIDDGFHGVGEDRRLTEAIESFRIGNRTLLGSLQLSFFDTNPAEMNG
jgi:DNA-binding MarR family transcriptional regulator